MPKQTKRMGASRARPAIVALQGPLSKPKVILIVTKRVRGFFGLGECELGKLRTKRAYSDGISKGLKKEFVLKRGDLIPSSGLWGLKDVLVR